MDIKKAYDTWSEQYDANNNKTRDLEAKAIKESLQEINFNSCLEIGCGTGKNTKWLLTKAEHITSVDISDQMLARAKAKIKSDKVQFIQADITKRWTFTEVKYDIVTFSLVLEHIENLEHIFRETSAVLANGGYVYIGELHPFKQYAGTKARFETADGLHVLDCFNHNISDFILSAKQFGFELKNINEYFDNDDRTNIPRILTLVLKK